MRSPIYMLFIAACLVGCNQSRDIRDLEEFTENAFKDYVPEVEPLPALKPQAVFIYTASALTDPFDKQNLQEKVEPLPLEGGEEGPDRSRRKEPLELFPLDSLKLVGVLEQNGENWAVIRAPDSSVHRVKAGNYMGEDFGEIEEVGENTVELTELVRNPVGRWESRDANLLLVE
ncbi:MAG: pilus assembly protein PilP [Acidiferrobacterales bacterium]|nr:pilus assembly protein PilP [Acidiferrobacterales bacterium]